MPFNLICPSSRGLSLSLARLLLSTSTLPLIATARSDPVAVRSRILSNLPSGEDRLHVLQVDVTSESTLSRASEAIRRLFGDDHIHLAFSTPGTLFPERSPTDLNKDHIIETMNTNLLGPMLIMKHFSPFLPVKKSEMGDLGPSKWINMSARVGSIGDNNTGGWFSYRATKAGVNQITRGLDIWLRNHAGGNAMAFSMHPGTVKTGLSQEFWSHIPEGKLFEPEDVAEKVMNVVRRLTVEDRGGFYDWKGERIPW